MLSLFKTQNDQSFVFHQSLKMWFMWPYFPWHHSRIIIYFSVNLRWCNFRIFFKRTFCVRGTQWKWQTPDPWLNAWLHNTHCMLTQLIILETGWEGKWYLHLLAGVCLHGHPVTLKLNVVFPLHLSVLLLGEFDKRQHKRLASNVWGKIHQNRKTFMPSFSQ